MLDSTVKYNCFINVQLNIAQMYSSVNIQLYINQTALHCICNKYAGRVIIRSIESAQNLVLRFIAQV
ncbi:hypothetical protein D3C86_1735130 [compost metagenome]